jgi:hypothetical protein
VRSSATCVRVRHHQLAAIAKVYIFGLSNFESGPQLRILVLTDPTNSGGGSARSARIGWVLKSCLAKSRRELCLRVEASPASQLSLLTGSVRLSRWREPPHLSPLLIGFVEQPHRERQQAGVMVRGLQKAGRWQAGRQPRERAWCRRHARLRVKDGSSIQTVVAPYRNCEHASRLWRIISPRPHCPTDIADAISDRVGHHCTARATTPVPGHASDDTEHATSYNPSPPFPERRSASLDNMRAPLRHNVSPEDVHHCTAHLIMRRCMRRGMPPDRRTREA